MPVGTCHRNRPTLRALKVMCALRAASLPFAIAGVMDAASAQSTVIAAPAYRCGPGNSLPVGVRTLQSGP